MVAPDPQSQREADRLLTAGVMVVIFRLLGCLNVQLAPQPSGSSTLSARNASATCIKRSTSYYMLRNDREGLYHTMATMADEPGMVRVRIFDHEGRISYSTVPAKSATSSIRTPRPATGATRSRSRWPAEPSRPLPHLSRPTAGSESSPSSRRSRTSRPARTRSAMPIPPASRFSACSIRNLSLAKADAQLAESTQRMLVYTLIAMLLHCAAELAFRLASS